MTLHARLTALRDQAWIQLEAAETIDPGLLRLVADATTVLNAIDAPPAIPVYRPMPNAPEIAPDEPLMR